VACWAVALAELSLSVGMGALLALVWTGRRDLSQLQRRIEEKDHDSATSYQRPPSPPG